MLKKARLIVTDRCDKKCRGCCNTYSRIMRNCINITSTAWLKYYDVVCITGGEPLLEFEKTLEVVNEIVSRNPRTKIYLYTAAWPRDSVEPLLQCVDGVQYSIHAEATIRDVLVFKHAQRDLYKHRGRLSLRLYIDKECRQVVPVYPHMWDKVTVDFWKSEERLITESPSGNGLPEGEDLFRLI